ncbi:MAG: hypothetical protein A3D92_07765, partial [Bacteroidetes bacterium RIFCSPHIGHO2_02_FULL_44_7]
IMRLAFAMFLLMSSGLQAQTTISGSFDHGGITRTYSFYVPASNVPGQPVALVLNLHGLSTDGAFQSQYRDFKPIADTANFIVAHPDGSMLLGQRFWNYGNVFGSTVDDVGFLEALIDTIAASYSINPDRVYCAGMSNGSFMSYFLACQSDRFAAIATVTGSMSVDMYNSCTPSHPIPAIHIHGLSDGVNPYSGTSTMQDVASVNMFWVNQNGCSTTPLITQVPDIDPGDNASAEQYLYAGGIHGHTVELFTVTGGGHTWPGAPVPGATDNTCMDFSASKEIWRFFSQYERAGEASVVENSSVEWNIWPNPANDFLYLDFDQGNPKRISISNVLGREVIQQTDQFGIVDLRGLSPGNYTVRVSGDDFVAVKRLNIVSVQ